MDPNWINASAAVASAIAAGASLIVAIIAVKTQRGAVRPVPFGSFGDYENEIHVSIQNRGVGPLVIDSIAVENWRTKEIKKNVIDFMPDLPDGVFWEDFVSADIEGRPLTASAEIILLKFSMPAGLNPSLPAIRKIFG